MSGEEPGASAPPRKTRCLGVIHVPKCGGVSIREAVAKLPGSYSGPLYFDEDLFGSAQWVEGLAPVNREKVATQADLAPIARSHRLLIGHYSGATLTAAGCGAVAVQVREPCSRLLSLYRFWQAQDAEARATWGPWGEQLVAKADLPFNDFLADPVVWPAVDNALVRQVLGYRSDARGHRAHFIQRRHVMARFSRLRQRLAIADWSSKSERFLERICANLEVSTPPELGHENATEVVGEEQALDRKSAALLEQLTHVDRMFLGRLSTVGILPRRTPRDMDREFEATATRLGFRLP